MGQCVKQELLSLCVWIVRGFAFEIGEYSFSDWTKI